MSFVQINKKDVPMRSFALFNLGFRPFFLGASIFASISIVMWALVYFSYISFITTPFSSFQWHAHEMIYGFSMAVIAGFLLTAVMNWSGIQTIHDQRLAFVFVLWILARIFFSFGSEFILYAAICDLLFMLSILFAVAIPIFKSRQWSQIGIIAKVLLLFIGNLVFYLGVLGALRNGIFWGIYGGLYLVISLILTIGGRVIPAFIRNGLEYEVNIKNPFWVMIANLVLFLVFIINQLFIHNQILLGFISTALFVINSWRLYCWYTPGIWRKPLLWSLYLAIVFINLGFFLFALSAFFGLSQFIAIHAFAFGGIGLATLSMMARVILGHTGRDVRNPPLLTNYALILLALGAVIRVILPIIKQSSYTYWIALSQIFWITAFIIFIVVYSKMLFQPRVDGQPG